MAVDKTERDSTTISIVVKVQKKLEKYFDQPTNKKSAFKKRMNMTLSSPVHYWSNMIDHQLQGKNLTEEKSKGHEYLI